MQLELTLNKFCGICQMMMPIMPLKVSPNTALVCNHQSICMPQLHPLCSAALVPNVLPRRNDGSGNALCSWSSLIEYWHSLGTWTRDLRVHGSLERGICSSHVYVIHMWFIRVAYGPHTGTWATYWHTCEVLGYFLLKLALLWLLVVWCHLTWTHFIITLITTALYPILKSSRPGNWILWKKIISISNLLLVPTPPIEWKSSRLKRFYTCCWRWWRSQLRNIIEIWDPWTTASGGRTANIQDWAASWTI